MTEFTNHPAFSWLGKDVQSLLSYAECFYGAKIIFVGESPYLDAKKAGIELVLNADHSVKAVHFYAQDTEDFHAYAEPLPGGLTLSNSREEVLAAFGSAAMSMDPGGIGLMAIEFAFDRFETSEHYLRFEYLTGEGAIRLVTIGFNS